MLVRAPPTPFFPTVSLLLLLLTSHALLHAHAAPRVAADDAATPTSRHDLPPSTHTCSDSERTALVQLKKGLDDPGGRLSSWTGLHCCRWAGVACGNLTGSVVGVDLRGEPAGSSLSGRIDPSLLGLESLRYLDLSGNSFRHTPIPAFIGSLTHLRYLNLSNSGFTGVIPPQLGNLSTLRYLDLSCDHGPPGMLRVHNLEWVAGLPSLTYLALDGVDLSSAGPEWAGSLNEHLPRLVELHLRGCGLGTVAASLPSANFTALELIDLSSNNLSSVRIPGWLPNITGLASVDLSHNSFHGPIPLDFSKLPHLQHLDLSSNPYLPTDVSELLGRGGWPAIKTLSLSGSGLHGEIPPSIGNLTSLVKLNLSSNFIGGKLPGSIGKLCNLTTLIVRNNNLAGALPESLEPPPPEGDCVPSGGHRPASPLPRMMWLNLRDNSLTGELPAWLPQLGGLQLLSLANNYFQGELPQAIGELSELFSLDVFSNNFTGTVTEAHFSKLSRLEILGLGDNSLTLDVGSDWTPPFRLDFLSLDSCGLGPKVPSWIENQGMLRSLSLSGNKISGEVPVAWLQQFQGLQFLDLSKNNLAGSIPASVEKLSGLEVLDLAHNNLSGVIPVSVGELRRLKFLDLSVNNLMGRIPPSIGKMGSLWILDLSRNRLDGGLPASLGELSELRALALSENRLTGGIPTAWLNCSSSLTFLNLESNNLSGHIPTLIGQLTDLKVSLLGDNELTGEIPSSLRHCSALEALDLSQNRLHGSIPTWIDNLRALKFLQLGSNGFSGEIPSQLSRLRFLKVLVLAENGLTGPIPKELGSLESMSPTKHRPLLSSGGPAPYEILNSYVNDSYYYQTLHMKGSRLRYEVRSGFLVNAVDLSGNKLSGEFPESLVQLCGLVALDLSGNLLSGTIPNRIGDMLQLQSLDLSNNHFSGGVPPSMVLMSFLSFLNLSNNNFSGEIPVGGQLQTFDDAFLGNPYLCGPFLRSNCSRDDPDPTDVNREAETHTGDSYYFGWGLGLGFALGLLLPFILLITTRSWSVTYFAFVDKLVDRFF